MKKKTMLVWGMASVLGASLFFIVNKSGAEKQTEPGSESDKAVLAVEVNNAKKITKEFVTTLKGALQSAMKEGGPVNALTVCNTTAMPITTTVAQKNGVLLTRVSLKNRNPDNLPNGWQKTVLEDFDRRAASGEDIKTMAYAKIVDEAGAKQFRFMKAIPTGKVCLACHGSTLTPEVSARLKQLYPYDKATGYKAGQVRGAVVIVKNL